MAALRAEAIWLSPIFPSPMADFGYDVSDYCDVDPQFGTLADLDELIGDCHARDIRVVLDWVPNHTSDQHPWFRDPARRDWYVWRDPAPDGGPPNDWRSAFAAVGAAWTLDAASGQYYLHSFMPEQPDLNWDNPAVEAAMHDVLRFWLDRGIDGFRLDAIAKIAKDPLMRSNGSGSLRHDEDWETIHERLRGIRRVIDEYDDRMIVGEVALDDLHRIVGYLESGDQLHLAHNFVFVQLPWDAEAFQTSIDDFEELADSAGGAGGERSETDAWPAWFLENHDISRVATRFGSVARARAVLVMLYALRGTPFVYQGQELGLPDAVVPPERMVDVDGRDGERAPMPWSADACGGWVDPWLPPVTDAAALSVESQAADPASALSLARRLAELRRAEPSLQTGSQRRADAAPDVLAWVRDERVLAAVNFSDEPVALPAAAGGELLLSSDPGREAGPVEALAPSEAVLVRL